MTNLPDMQLYLMLALSVTMVSILGAIVIGTNNASLTVHGMILTVLAWLLLFVASLLSWSHITLWVWVAWKRTSGAAYGWHWWTLIFVGFSVLALLLLQAEKGYSSLKQIQEL